MFGVDLEELLDTVAEMTRCTDALDGLLDEVARTVAEMHHTWSGQAATAQAAAQAEWEAGFRSMREALAVMRSAASTAHGNYADAATTNQQMWEQVR